EAWLRSTGVPSGTREVGNYMRLMFEKRIAERNTLVESAKAGELTPSGARKLAARDTQPSMPGKSDGPPDQTAAAPRAIASKRLIIGAGAAVAAGLLTIAIVAIASRPSQPEISPLEVRQLAAAPAQTAAPAPAPVPPTVAAPVKPPPPAARPKGRLTLDTNPWA